MTARQPTGPRPLVSYSDPSPGELTAGELVAALVEAADDEVVRSGGGAASSMLSTTLRERLVHDGMRQVEALHDSPSAVITHQTQGEGGGGSVKVAASSHQAEAVVLSPVSRARPFTARFGWLAAAAALVVWLTVPSPLRRVDVRGTVPQLVAAAALRDSLLASGGTMRVNWSPSTDPAATQASGDVVWSGTQQRGVLRIVGLAPNDPRSAQYQLWIVDAERDARYPVDGGVFDILPNGEVLVPVRPRLKVSRPTLFAVTLERPGGVVVSSRERLVLAAPVGG